MRMKNLVLAVAATCMTVTPVLAAKPAAKLSVVPSVARASAQKGESTLAGTGLIVALVVAAVVAIVVIADDGGSKSP